MDRYGARDRHGTTGNAGSHYYGEGAPHGDPFQVTGHGVPGPQALGLGRPPAANHRSTSLNTPIPASRARQPARATSDTFDHYPDALRTPTPANVYRHPLDRGLSIQEDKTDRILDMLQTVLHDNVKMKQRLSFLEELVSQPHVSAAVRGLPAQRGVAAATALRRRPQKLSDDSDNEGIDPSLRRSDRAASTTDYSAESDIEPVSVDEDDGPDLAMIDVSDAEKRALQTFVTKKFRGVCDVPGSNWPDPSVRRVNETTGQVYPTPFLHLPVSDSRNRAVLMIVAKEANEELKDKEVWPKDLKRPRTEPDPTWDLAFIVSLTKASFGTFKRQWNDKRKEQAGIETGTSGQNNRQNKRRRRKADQLKKVVEKYAQEHGLDKKFLLDLINEQYLSDEVSGPEQGSGESKEAWKVRMAVAAGKGTDPATPRNSISLKYWFLNGVHFKFVFFLPLKLYLILFQYSDLIHDIEKLRFEDEETKLVYTRVSQRRISNRIPKYAPYNFGIAREWFNEHRNKPAYRSILKDWDNYPEPENCGLRLAPHPREVDPRFNFEFNN
ncbi:hypothetical protein DFH06DRAFT_1467431 [Mycena polygramma]|nr:hypothetical protein DFH06DRAFT_1467431 [Mycena polygramma]